MSNSEAGVKKPSRGAMFGIVLAAGESSRMGEPKQLLTYGGSSFLFRAIEGMLRAGIDDVVAVCGYRFEDMKRHIMESRFSAPADEIARRLTVAENPDYKKGQLSSIKAGLAALAQKKAIDFYRGFMIQLIDRPLVRYETFKKLKEAFIESGSLILLPSYEMKRGHPACFSAELAPRVMALGAGESLRTVLTENEKEIRYLDVGDAGVIANIDTPLEYEKIKGVVNVD